MITFDIGEVKVTVWKATGDICIVKSHRNVYLTLSELAGIGEAVAVYLKKDAELEYEKFSWPPAGET